MATHNNNSDQMSTQDIKNVLINTFKRSAEKSVQDASYDKTILATIQFCTDSSIGQYKIKYQNGYYTAYAKDTSMMYTNNTPVYVSVPGNNMNNRLFIIGAASNDNSQRIYLTNLEGDQQYSVEGSNYITDINGSEADLNMSSYWGTSTVYTKVLYKADGTDNILSINPQANEYLHSAKVIRLGASFRTDLDDNRKNGDYGIVLILKYKNDKGEYYYKNFTLDTFHMIGSPFNFNVFMPQYNYFDVDQTEFVCIEEIDEYVTGFPSGTIPSYDDRDIFVKDISLYKAVKLYDTNNEKYRVEVQSEDNFDFYAGTSAGVDTYKSQISCRATLKVNGNPVSNQSGQNVQYFWAKEDISVNSVNHPKYNRYTGKGWYCLNTGSKVKYDGTATAEDLQDYTILQDNVSTPSEMILWDSNMPQINLLRTLCKGKQTRIKCVVFYENQIIESEIKTVLNKEGYYILINSQDDKTVSYNGKGNFILTAGVFQDGGEDTPNKHSLDANITYHWTEINEKGIEKNIPLTWQEAEQDINDLLLSQPEWDKDEDNETKTDEEVATYLHGDNGLAWCRERYEYYNSKYTELNTQQSPDETQLSRCYNRKTAIIQEKFAYVQSLYNGGSENTQYYIVGPSDVEAIYTNSDLKDYRSAKIDSTSRQSQSVGKYNTLFNLPANKIGNKATYRVTALSTEIVEDVELTLPIGTTEITLVNQSGASLDYTLEITNGTQVFLYDEGGKAPDNLIRPLYFRLFDRDGNLLFDSQNPENYSETNLTLLQPVWTLYNSAFSLIMTGYPGSNNCTELGELIEVRNQGDFVYSLQKNFDVNKRDKSNINLQITYQNSVIYGETHFTYLKQGDLGTNGTDMVLDIDDNNYEAYKSNILSDMRWSSFETKVDGVTTTKYYQPQQRHLGNTYLFATMAYDANGIQQATTEGCNFVNLQFAQSGIEIDEDLIGVLGSNTASLFGYWYQDGVMQPVDNEAKWSSEIVSGKYNGESYYLKPSFDIETSIGSNTNIKLNYISNEQDVDMYYKPTVVEDVSVEGTLYDKRIANNIVRVESKTTVNGRQVSNYGYYPIPYFYYNYTGSSPMPSGFDPAKHIIITGGFDSIVYDSAGENPSYDKQEPFTFFMFDENGKDITSNVLEGVNNNRTTITWACSNGLTKSPWQLTASNSIPNYNDISNDVNLLNTYCRYNSKVYRCIKSYTKGQTVEIKNSNDEIIKKYNPGEFVTPYWEEVNELQEIFQKYSVSPLDKYDMVAQRDLFNSWISLTINYTDLSNKVYDVQVMIPINILCNKYGSTEINNWDGKKCLLHEDEGYLIGSKIAAGVKNDDNSFTGITLGTNFYPDNSNRKEEIGLFGFGITDTGKTLNPQAWARTLFLNARSGRAIFGPTGATQIVLDPSIPTGSNRVWSRLGGWYFDRDFLYKPIGEGNTLNFNELAQDETISPPDTGLGSAGLYVPWDTSGSVLESTTRFIWASNNNITYENCQTSTPNFYVTYGGKLYCNNAEITGSITANDGSFGTGTNKININYTDADHNHYILYNRNFWVRDSNGEGADDNAVYVKGKIMAKSGQFGQVGDDKDGYSSGTVFIEYHWYPWHLPADNEPWTNDYMYLDTSEGMSTTYALYHKNFYVKNNGDAFFNGKLFTESGRIGNWVINRNYLKSVNGNMILAPERLTLGAFSADQYGNLRGQSWFINADGTASFTNNGNEFVGRSFRTANGSSMGEGGLRLGPGDKFYIGADDSTYMVAGNNGFTFNGYVNFTDTVSVRNAEIDFIGNGGTLAISSNGIYLTNKRIYTNGDASLGSVSVDSLTIGGTSLADYIRSVASVSVARTKLGQLNPDSYVVTNVT